MSRNYRLPCAVELQPLSLTPLKMRKVELGRSVNTRQYPSCCTSWNMTGIWNPTKVASVLSQGCSRIGGAHGTESFSLQLHNDRLMLAVAHGV